MQTHPVHLLHELNEDAPGKTMQCSAIMMDMIFQTTFNLLPNEFLNKHNSRYCSAESLAGIWATH